MNDVRFEMDMAPRGSDRLQPCGIILAPVPEQAYAISGDEACGRRARECVVGKSSQPPSAFALPLSALWPPSNNLPP